MLVSKASGRFGAVGPGLVVSSFAFDVTKAFGNSPRFFSNVRNPGVTNLDFSLQKDFKILLVSGLGLSSQPTSSTLPIILNSLNQTLILPQAILRQRQASVVPGLEPSARLRYLIVLFSSAYTFTSELM